MSRERGRFGDLADLFKALAARIGDIQVELRGGVSEYRRGATLFAALEGGAAELRLHPEVAEAARRTASTGTSARGREWVRFSPPDLDQQALDRAEAWFLSAWRRAGSPNADV